MAQARVVSEPICLFFAGISTARTRRRLVFVTLSGQPPLDNGRAVCNTIITFAKNERGARSGGLKRLVAFFVADFAPCAVQPIPRPFSPISPANG